MQLLRSGFVAFVFVALAALHVDGLTVAVAKHPTGHPRSWNRWIPSLLEEVFSPCPSAAGCKQQLSAVQIGQAITVKANAPDGIITEADKASDPHWVQSMVWRVTFVMAALLTASGFAIIFYRRNTTGEMIGEKGAICAYISQDEDGPVDCPDTDEEEGCSPKRILQSSGADSMNTLPAMSRTYSMYISQGQCVTKNADELVDEVGISALCILHGSSDSGISKLPSRIAVPLIAIQASLLQGALLYFLGSQIIPRVYQHDHFEVLPHTIVGIAIYLHFLNCTQELPYAWQLLNHFADFHQDMSDIIVLGTVLILDSFVVPILSFFLGALYLCTSRSIGDVILNAVAVAFVHDIDNWILNLNSRVNMLAGYVSNQIVHIPINRPAMRVFSWIVIFVPVVPIAASLGFCYLGFNVLRL